MTFSAGSPPASTTSDSPIASEKDARVREPPRADESARPAEAVPADIGESLRAAIESAGMGLFELGLDDGRLEWSAQLGRHYGLDAVAPPVAAMDALMSRVHVDDRAQVAAALARAIDRDGDGDGRLDCVHRTMPVDGQVRWLHLIGCARAPHPGGANRGARLFGLSLDVTDTRRMEHSVREREERLRMAIEATGSGTYDWDLTTDTLVWDERTRELFDLDPDDTPSLQRFYERLHPDDRVRLQREIEAALSDPHHDGTWRTGYRVRRRGGGYRWIDSPGRIRFEGEGRGRQPVRFVGLVTDVTEQRDTEQALRDSEERFRLAVQSSSLGTWDMDPATMQVRWSDNAQRMFGLAGRDQVGLAEPIAVIHADDRPRVEAAIATALDPAGNGEYETQYRVVRPDGTLRWLEAVGLAKFEGEGQARHATRLAGVLWDVTEQQMLLDNLREADRRKDEFLAMLAHELRNPLAPLVNAHRLLARGASLHGRDRAALALAERQTRQMQRLVDDLLEVGRITRGRIALRCEPTSVGAAVYNAAESVGAAIEARRQTLALVLPERVSRIVADPARLAQVLENLLHNASKYTPEGGAIRIEVDDAPGRVDIRVTDNGRGIEPDKLEHIFDLFTQVDATFDRAAGGLGIGLALVKRLVELHGGRVTAHSAGPGHGATFTVSLPRQAPAGAAGQCLDGVPLQPS